MKHHGLRRSLLAGMAGLALFGAVAAQAGDYPSKPIRLVVAYPPGGPLDILARVLAEPLGTALGQPLIIENRAGAGGVIGSDFVAKAQPDGYTILLGSTPLAIQETLYRKLPYSATRDLTPIANLAEGPQVLVVGSAVPVKTVQELIDYGRAQHGKLNYASPSAGGTNHLAAELLKMRGGFEATHIAYKGGAPAEIAIISGDVAFGFGALTGSLQQVRQGRLRALGVTSKQRWPSAPDVPAIAETLPGFDVSSWYGLLGPAGMPAEVVQRLNSEVNKILAQPAMKKRLVDLDLLPAPGTPAQFRAYLHQNIDMWGKVVRDAGITVD
ncbi:Bug family tripartite tricarboxylate transporter substrate binding protein [Variovorax sp. PBL-E5]|uniref:Bug family tripartite tricarboxylate transporter substrate binding protein n=1 Tax=Variovorax sp. PBL-E5 TaxID=434014 RepID=UPI0013185D7B|nr:tripartite tricarboxylate transporter substrate binding protein [Variovorax sp. PBL-E5]VTU19733.1 Argininosuccinate lyase [Variovorax sp. PBL-E5]